MIQKLQIPYSTWDRIVTTSGLKVYHADDAEDTAVTWCGVRSIVYSVYLSSDTYPAWSTDHKSNSTAVVDENDAIAHILGLENPELSPQEEDGRPIVVLGPMTPGLNTYFTGAGDDTAAQSRGTGAALTGDFSTGGGEVVERSLDFIEMVELHDGQLTFYPSSSWGKEDTFDIFLRMPATPYTAAPASDGNCDLIPIGGGANVIVPRDGNGNHNVDLTTAVPVPSAGSGYWHVDTDTGDVSVSPVPGSGKYTLLTVPTEPYFMRNMPMGHPLGVFDMEADRSRMIHKRWNLVLRVTKASAGGGEFSGWLKLFRKSVT